jgi:hypothetical protein
MTSETDLAYMAATIDDEGSICVLLPHHRPSGWLRISVANTDCRLIEWLQKTFGGRYSTRYYSKGKGYLYNWMIHGRQAQEILRKVLPYLKIKHEQAEEVLKITYGKSGIWITDKERTLRKQVREKVMELNNTKREFPKSV